MRAKNGEPKRWLLDHINHQDKNECLIWPFGQSHGYGIINNFSRPQSPTNAHRAMCLLAHGPAPEGKPEAAHSCGNRLCVNPHHLRHATYEENSADKLKHGRENFGERNGAARYSESDILAIRERVANGERQSEVRKEYGMSSAQISRICSGKRWSHLSERKPDKKAIGDQLKAGVDVPGARLVTGEDGVRINSK